MTYGEKMKLNLGCGTDWREGYINVDFNKDVKSDLIFDLNHLAYPFEDNSISEIIINHALEHLTISIPDFFKECYRILKPNGILHLEVPNAFFWRYRLRFLCGNMRGSWWSPFHTKLLHPRMIEDSAQIIGFAIVRKKYGLFFLPRSWSEQNLVYILRKMI